MARHKLRQNAARIAHDHDRPAVERIRSSLHRSVGRARAWARTPTTAWVLAQAGETA